MQRVIKRSDGQSVTPPTGDGDRAKNEILRFVFGGGCDEDPEEDLYETLISKGLVEKSQNGLNKNRALEEDSLTASCTESYSSSWSNSLHDSFGQEGSLPQHYQPSPHPYPSPLSHSVTGSPRRRRMRRGSFDRSAMMTVAAPPLSVGQIAINEPSSATATTDAALAAAAATAQPRLRAPRRRHGSFLESSSTSCCLNDIVEETENTESSSAAPVEFDGDASDGVLLSLDGNYDEAHCSGRGRVKFGCVEIRSYAVTLDQVGGYGLEGKPVPCPLTLDWQYDDANVVRKPAILFGYTSYFQQVKLRPTTVDERRARLGVFHNMRQPQVRRWEYKALLHQMAALHSGGYVPDRWQERSDDDDFDAHRVVGDDRLPSEPARRTAKEGAIDSLCDAVTNSCQVASMEVPAKRGIDMPIVPMQWIDHNSRRPESKTEDSWKPLDPVWLDAQPVQKRNSKHDHQSGRHCMPTMPSLWLHDPHIVDCLQDASDQIIDAEVTLPTEFQAIPFETIVTSRVKERVLAESAVKARTKDWKRSPPGRSNVKRITPDVVPGAAFQSASPKQAISPMPRLPFLWINDESLARDSTEPSATSDVRVGDPVPDEDIQSISGEFRKVPFEDLVTAACRRPQGSVLASSSGRRSITLGRSLDEVEWRRCIGGSSPNSDDKSLESLTWLEELAKLGRSRRAPIPESVHTVMGGAEELRDTVMKSSEALASSLPTANVGGASSEVSERVPGEKELTDRREVSVRDWTSPPLSEPTSVAGMLHRQPIMCLYQDVPKVQVQPSKRPAGRVPFVWLPSPTSAAPKDEGL